MNYLQKLGKALMVPVACLPICAILMGIGYFLCPATMQGGDINGIWNNIGLFLVKAGGAIIDNMTLLFVIGVGLGLAKDNDGVGALASIVAYLIITNLLSTNFVIQYIPSVANNLNQKVAFDKINNPFIGILSGIIGSQCYNHFYRTRLPDFLAFFSGKRCVAIISGVVSIIIAGILLLVWPLFFSLLLTIGRGASNLGAVGAGIYAFLNRLLIPTGLHHALNNVFWFDTIGLGDLTNFWAGKTSKDVTWSLGMYMSGFFPCMMFGIPGATLAIIRHTESKDRKKAFGLFGSAAICAFICGVTEPFEFAFMFMAPPLYVIYALLYGIFTFITTISGFRAGFSFSAGATDLLFSGSLPAAQKTWLIIPLGILAFVVFYGAFAFYLKKKKVNLINGNEIDVLADIKKEHSKNTSKEDECARRILEALGGSKNIVNVDACSTRLRFEIKDRALIDEQKIKASGALGHVFVGETSLQVIVGTQVLFVESAIKKLMID